MNWLREISSFVGEVVFLGVSPSGKEDVASKKAWSSSPLRPPGQPQGIKSKEEEEKGAYISISFRPPPSRLSPP